MAINKTVKIDQFMIDEYGNIHVRTATILDEDGVEIPGSRTFHRHVVQPGDSSSKEDPKVKALVNLFHTPEVIAAAQARRDASKPK